MYLINMAGHGCSVREDVREEVYQLPAWVASRTLNIVVSPVFRTSGSLQPTQTCCSDIV